MAMHDKQLISWLAGLSRLDLALIVLAEGVGGALGNTLHASQVY